MLKKLLLFFSAIIFSFNVFSQAPDWLWAKGIGGVQWDHGWAIATDDSGNVYTTGEFEETVDFDPGSGVFNLYASGIGIFVSKLDAQGNFVWAKSITGSGDGSTYSIAVDASGNIYLTGIFIGTSDFDPGSGVFNLTSTVGYSVFILKLDSAGNFLWAKQMGKTYYDPGQSITIDSSGNIYTTGNFQDTADFDPGPGVFNLISAGLQDIFISKLDSSGNFLWAKRVGGPQNDSGLSIALDASGNVYTTGSFWNTVDFDPSVGAYNLISHGSSDMFILKLDNMGNFIWATAIGGPISDYGLSIMIDVTGNVFTTGSFSDTVDFNPGSGVFNLISTNADIFVSKSDSLGSFVWAAASGGPFSDIGYALDIDLYGHVYVTGYYEGPNVSFGSTTLPNVSSQINITDIFIAKLDTLVTGVIETENSYKSLFLSPNPATNELRIQSRVPGTELKIESIEFYNTFGQSISSQKPKANNQQQVIIDISNFSPGIYFIKLITESGTIAAKFVKQ